MILLRNYGLYLKALNIHAFLDKKCLKDGEGWKVGFSKGLKNSRVFLALISSKALFRVRDPHADHTYDNVLLEYETALKIDSTDKDFNYICPLHIGEYKNDGSLIKFNDFASNLYPDSISPILDSLLVKTSPPTNFSKEMSPRNISENVICKSSLNEVEEDNEAEEYLCPVCNEALCLTTYGIDNWACQWPDHNEENNSFAANANCCACATKNQCEWAMCQDCFICASTESITETNDDAKTISELQIDKFSINTINNNKCQVLKVIYSSSLFCNDSITLKIISTSDGTDNNLEDPLLSKLIINKDDVNIICSNKLIYKEEKNQIVADILFNLTSSHREYIIAGIIF